MVVIITTLVHGRIAPVVSVWAFPILTVAAVRTVQTTDSGNFLIYRLLLSTVSQTIGTPGDTWSERQTFCSGVHRSRIPFLTFL